MAVMDQKFEDAMRAAEEAAGVPSDRELYGDLVTPRNEAENVAIAESAAEAAAEQVVESAAGEEAEPAAEEPKPADDSAAAEPESKPLLAGKYDTPEALEQAYLEAQRRLGELGNEVGGLRQLQSEFEQLRQQLAQPAYQPVDQATVDWFDEFLTERPDQATAWALENQPVLYDRAIRNWYEADPVNAGRFERQLELQNMQAEIAKSMQPRLAIAEQAAQRDELTTAWAELASRHEDFVQVVGNITDERLREIGYPTEHLQGLMGDQASKQRALETLYRWVKADQAGTLVNAAAEAAVQQAEASRAAKQEALVASASTTTPEAVPETEQERLMRVWKEQSPSLRSGWTGVESRRK